MTFLQYAIFSILFLLLPTCSIIGAEDKIAEQPSVAFLGESYSSDNEEFGINEDILSRLFTLIAKTPPSAVIFTGNMTLGLQNSSNGTQNNKKSEQEIAPTPQPLLDAIDATKWPHAGYSFDRQAFQKSIARFMAIKEDTLGKNIPFYPVLGEHEAYGPEALEIILSTFKVPSQVPSFVSPLAYTFSIDKSLFVVFSIAQFAKNGKGVTSSDLSPPLIQWLNDTLEEQGKNYEFIFVVGNEPAYSTTAVTADFQGLDTMISQRDLFWRILMKYKVTAYFCAQEHLYDRTNRHGIWQIISGGAGAPLYKRNFDKAFYHYLKLLLPTKSQKLPKLQVFDIQGKIIDEIELSPSQYPVYQLRIS